MDWFPYDKDRYHENFTTDSTKYTCIFSRQGSFWEDHLGVRIQFMGQI